MPGIFLGLKFQGCVFFLGLQYEAPSDPPVMYTSSTPPPPSPSIVSIPFTRLPRKLEKQQKNQQT